MLTLSLLALTTPAFGVDLDIGREVTTIHALGNGELYRQVLESIRLVVHDPLFTALITLVAVLGAIGVVTAGLTDLNRATIQAFTLVIGLLLTRHLAIEVGVDLAIEDPVEQSTSVVTDVPALVALPLGLMNAIGHGLTTTLEQNFMTLDSNLYLTAGDFNLTAAMLHDATRIRITDPNLKESITHYVDNCTLPDIVNGNLSVAELMTAPQLWQALRSEQQVLLTPYSDENGEVTLVNCLQGHDQISSRLQQIAPELVQLAAPSWHGEAPFHWVAGALSSANSYAGSSVTDARAIAAQTAIINEMNGALRHSAALVNANSLLLNLNLSQAEQGQLASWSAAAQMFKNITGYVFSTLQIFIPAISLIILLLVFMPTAGRRILLSYLKILLWFTLWEPGLAIINFLISAWSVSEMQGLFSHGYTLGNIAIISEKSAKSIAAGGFLATSVPILMWQIVNGQIALTHFMMSGLGTALGEMAGRRVAEGSLSQGNVSINRHSMNSHDYATESTAGYLPATTTTGGSLSALHYDAGGTRFQIGGETVGRHQSHTTSARSGDTTTHSRQQSQSNQQQQQWHNSQSHTQQESLSQQQGEDAARRQTITEGSSHNTSQRNSTENGIRRGRQLDRSESTTAQQGLQRSLSLHTTNGMAAVSGADLLQQIIAAHDLAAGDGNNHPDPAATFSRFNQEVATTALSQANTLAQTGGTAAEQQQTLLQTVERLITEAREAGGEVIDWAEENPLTAAATLTTITAAAAPASTTAALATAARAAWGWIASGVRGAGTLIRGGGGATTAAAATAIGGSVIGHGELRHDLSATHHDQQQQSTQQRRYHATDHTNRQSNEQSQQQSLNQNSSQQLERQSSWLHQSQQGTSEDRSVSSTQARVERLDENQTNQTVVERSETHDETARIRQSLQGREEFQQWIDHYNPRDLPSVAGTPTPHPLPRIAPAPTTVIEPEREDASTPVPPTTSPPSHPASHPGNEGKR